MRKRVREGRSAAMDFSTLPDGMSSASHRPAMSSLNAANVSQVVARPGRAEQEKALRILAKSIFKELKAQGYDSRQVVSLATELIAQVTTDLADK